MQGAASAAGLETDMYQPRSVPIWWSPFVWAFLWIVFLAVWIALRTRERMRFYDLVEKAGQSGQTLPPELFARMVRRPGPLSDLRAGLIFTAIGVGLALSGVIAFFDYHGPDPHLFWGPAKFFPIPLMIGVAFLVMAYVRREKP